MKATAIVPKAAPRRKPAEKTEEYVLHRPNYQKFAFWVIGDSPLITHAWSEKAKSDMYNKQIKKIRSRAGPLHGTAGPEEHGTARLGPA